MPFPILSVIIFIPLIAGLVILLLPANRQNAIRWTALGASAATFLLTILLYFSYDIDLAGYQFLEKIPWVPALGISYSVGVDGLSTPMMLMAGIVLFCGVVISWKVADRPREFFAFLMFLGVSVLGVFASLDLFQLFFFFELAVFPKYLMIVLWGSPKTRDYGGMKLTLYLFLGSVVALIGSLALYFGSGLKTFDLLALQNAGFAPEFQTIWFPVLFLGFAVLGAIFPLHSWAPDGHVAAPTAISMMLAGVEMKVGLFAALRVAIILLPEGAKHWAWLILVLGVINVVYGAFVAMVQKDLKYVIGFSSVSHCGLILIGMASLTPEGLLGSGLQMFSHGIMTALFFAIVGMVYDGTHERDIPKLGGLIKIMPWAAVGFIIGGLVSMGMPGFSGFVAEYPIFMGVWQVMPLAAIVAALGILITSAYILLVIRRVFFGDLPTQFGGGLKEAKAGKHDAGTVAVRDISWMDKGVIALLAFIMVALGWFPGLMAPMINSAVQTILALVGGAS